MQGQREVSNVAAAFAACRKGASCGVPLLRCRSGAEVRKSMPVPAVRVLPSHLWRGTAHHQSGSKRQVPAQIVHMYCVPDMLYALVHPRVVWLLALRTVHDQGSVSGAHCSYHRRAAAYACKCSPSRMSPRLVLY